MDLSSEGKREADDWLIDRDEKRMVCVCVCVASMSEIANFLGGGSSSFSFFWQTTTTTTETETDGRTDASHHHYFMFGSRWLARRSSAKVGRAEGERGGDICMALLGRTRMVRQYCLSFFFFVVVFL